MRAHLRITSVIISKANTAIMISEQYIVQTKFIAHNISIHFDAMSREKKDLQLSEESMKKVCSLRLTYEVTCAHVWTGYI